MILYTPPKKKKNPNNQLRNEWNKTTNTLSLELSMMLFMSQVWVQLYDTRGNSELDQTNLSCSWFGIVYELAFELSWLPMLYRQMLYEVHESSNSMIRWKTPPMFFASLNLSKLASKCKDHERHIPDDLIYIHQPEKKIYFGH